MTGLPRTLGRTRAETPRAWNSTLPARTSGLRSNPGATPFTSFKTLGAPQRDQVSRSGGRTPRPNPGRARLRQRSAKTAKVYRDERVPLVAALLAEYPECQIRWDDGCTVQAVDVHELLSRGRGGSITERGNCRTACRHCHDLVTQNPAEAEKRGWLLKSGRPSKGVPRG